jgi:cytochrome c556
LSFFSEPFDPAIKETCMTKRPVCVASALAILAFSAWAGGTEQETPTIKQIMTKLHKGAKSHLNTLKAALKAESPDWKVVQETTKDVVIQATALAKTEPPKGEKANYEKLTDAYYLGSKALDEAAKAEDKAKATAALGKLGASCKSCHTAHKGQ